MCVGGSAPCWHTYAAQNDPFGFKASTMPMVSVTASASSPITGSPFSAQKARAWVRGASGAVA